LSIIVAIDGPAAAGKGTISKMVSEEYTLSHLDTGALYRASASRARALGLEPITAAQTLQEEDLERTDLRDAFISQEASRISAIPDVRSALKEYQVSFSQQDGGSVLDGRDIALVIAPQSDVKLFIIASPEARAQRRHLEMLNTDPSARYEDILEEMRIRDNRDTSRTTDPLKPGPDSIIVDTSHLTQGEVIDLVREIIDPIIISRKTHER
jgi:cytidylate kinase